MLSRWRLEEDKFKDPGLPTETYLSPPPSSVTRSMHFLILFLCFWLKPKLLEIIKKLQSTLRKGFCLFLETEGSMNGPERAQRVRQMESSQGKQVENADGPNKDCYKGI